jgi:rhamnulokinase
MGDGRQFAAVDLGAESGRVVVGRLDGERIELEVAHRFDNRPVWLPDGLHWNLLAVFDETLRGLARSADKARLASVGVDAWGCDYAWIDGAGRILGVPFHYRDPRASAEVIAAVHARVPRADLYRRTGTQTIPINTVFQMSAEAGGAAASAAERIALIPDLFGLWLTGTLVNEVTVASTTGLLEARGRRWAVDLIERIGLPRRPFLGEVVAPGLRIGEILGGHEAAGAAVGRPVITVAGHDTASAFAAAPLRGPGAAVLSSGTWSLLGLELDEPELGRDAAKLNFTNERGVGDRTRLLRNVMGLWLLQECRRAWAAGGEPPSYDELEELARRARGDVALFDPDDDSLLSAGADMPSRIAGLCERDGQAPPGDRGELVRSILVSLACKYRLVIERLQRISRRPVHVIHVVGGGVRNELLCQLTSDLCQREVRAGPIEATALGNVLVQALAAGELSGLDELREMAARSAALREYEPGEARAAEEVYQRFLSLPSVSQPTPTAA